MRWLSAPWCTLPIELSGPGERPGLEPGAHPLVGPVADALLAVDRIELLAHDRVVRRRGPRAGASSSTWSTPRPADAVDAARARARHHLALARQRRVGDLPAVADLADPLRVGHTRAVEEHLVEVDLAADVAQRPDLDAGLVQVDAGSR